MKSFFLLILTSLFFSTAYAQRDPYEVLGVERTADAETVKTAYRRLLFDNHPDRTPTTLDAESYQQEVKRRTEFTKQLNVAYDILKRGKANQSAHSQSGSSSKPYTPPDYTSYAYERPPGLFSFKPDRLEPGFIDLDMMFGQFDNLVSNFTGNSEDIRRLGNIAHNIEYALVGLSFDFRSLRRGEYEVKAWLNLQEKTQKLMNDIFGFNPLLPRTSVNQTAVSAKVAPIVYLLENMSRSPEIMSATVGIVSTMSRGVALSSLMARSGMNHNVYMDAQVLDLQPGYRAVFDFIKPHVSKLNEANKFEFFRMMLVHDRSFEFDRSAFPYKNAQEYFVESSRRSAPYYLAILKVLGFTSRRESTDFLINFANTLGQERLDRTSGEIAYLIAIADQMGELERFARSVSAHIIRNEDPEGYLEKALQRLSEQRESSKRSSAPIVKSNPRRATTVRSCMGIFGG